MKDQHKYISFIVSFTLLFEWLKNYLSKLFPASWFLTAISGGVIALFIFLLHKWWDKVLWKKSPISKVIAFLVGFENYPAIEGEWKIKYVSSFPTKSGKGKRGSGQVSIQQNYSEVNLIDGNFGPNSTFESLYTTLQQKHNHRWFLIYLYENKPTSQQIINSSKGGGHKGFCYLEIINENRMEGYYSNDETRQTRGKIVFTKSRK